MVQRILVVDDAPDWLEMLTGVITDLFPDVEISAAKSAEEAKQALAQIQFDVALLDMRLDESNEQNIDGLLLAEEIQQTHPNTKPFIITGYAQHAGERLPVDYIEKSEVVLKLESTLAQALSGATESARQVLVLDDAPDWRSMLAGVIEDSFSDVKVTTASTLEEARRCLTKRQFDIAVLDMRLDEADETNQDGLWLAQEVHSSYPQTHVFVVTGYATMQSVEAGMQPDQSGDRTVVDFIEKRDIAELASRLEQYLPLKRGVGKP